MNEQQSSWAIVELFGHKTIAGQIAKETNPFPLLRIDVPATSEYPTYTIEYGPTAIYGITYVSEEVARAAAESLKVRPINIYSPELVTREQFERAVDRYKQQIAELRALPERANHHGTEDEDKDEDEDEKIDQIEIPF